MTPFVWLCLGHLVADWILQNDWMALGKRTSFINVAGLTHYTIYTIIILLTLHLSAPAFSATQYAQMAIFVFCSHWLVDGTDLVQRWMRWFGQRDQTMVRVMIDQTLHLLVLSSLVTVCFKQPYVV